MWSRDKQKEYKKLGSKGKKQMKVKNINEVMIIETSKKRKPYKRPFPKIGRNEIVIGSNGEKIKFKKLLNSDVIGEAISGLKNIQNETGIDSTNWGAEHADNAFDQEATEVSFDILEKYSDNKIKTILIRNNGNNLSLEDMVSRFISLPRRTQKYTAKMIGCRGFGGKAEWFRVGMPKWVVSKDDDTGKTIMMIFIPCSDDYGKKPIDIEDISKETIADVVGSIQWHVVELSDDYDKYFTGRGVSIAIHVSPDCELELCPSKINEFILKRFSQVKNFNFKITDKVADKTYQQKQLYFRTLDDKGNLISDYTKLNKYNQKLKAGDYEWDIYYHHRLSKKHDRKRFDTYHEKIKDDLEFSITKDGRANADQPVVNYLSEHGIVTQSRGRDWWSSWDSAKYGQLEIFIVAKQSLSKVYGRVKSNGMSDESLEREIGNNLIDIITSDDCFISPYRDASKKEEDSLVDQFVNMITHNKDGFTSRLCLGTLSDAFGNHDTLKNKMNWIIRRTLEGREIDIRLKSNWLMEWQPDGSDVRHLDGIHSRLNLICSQSQDYEGLIWVAKSHNHMDDLKKLMVNLKWNPNTSFRYIYFITIDEMMNGFVKDELPFIDLHEEILLQNN